MILHQLYSTVSPTRRISSATSRRARPPSSIRSAIPLGRLSDLLNDPPRDRSVIVHCAGGYRSSIAVSLLQRSGRMALSEIAGGIGAWEQAGRPVAGDQT
jgi:rhodanese-related sulfurtransferase